MKRIIISIVILFAVAANVYSQTSQPVGNATKRARVIPVVLQLDDERLFDDIKPIDDNPAATRSSVPPRPETTSILKNSTSASSSAANTETLRKKSLNDQAALENALQTHPENCGCPYCTGKYQHSLAKCPGCEEGWVNEFAPCRHCIQPRDFNGPTFCDLNAGDEPCGTCDACLEHRAAPCEHADEGWGPKGEFNPYHQNPTFSTPPRWFTGFINNGAHRFPIYYNPAPYYRPTWNPSMFAGYERPFTMRWTCEEVYDDSGTQFPQVVYGYSCKFCGRNPCACPADICNVNYPMNPKETSRALATMKAEANKKLIEDTGGVAGDREQATSTTSTQPTTGTPATQPTTTTTPSAIETLDDEGDLPTIPVPIE